MILALIGASAALAMGSNPGVEQPRRQPFIDHTIVKGDTLYALSRRYGSSVEIMIRINEIADVRKLSIGTHIQVPVIEPQPPIPVRVRSLVSDSSSLLEIERLLVRSETQLRNARFQAALESADAARALLDASVDTTHSASRVRLEVVVATVQVALEDRDAALSSLERALRADPDLVLDPTVVSPKILNVFRNARENIPSAP